MYINNEEFKNDLFELSKVWNNLTREMKELISKSIGGRESMLTIDYIMNYIYDVNEINKACNELKEVTDETKSVLSENQKDLLKELTTSFGIFAKFINDGVNDIKNHDEDLTDLNQEE